MIPTSEFPSYLLILNLLPQEFGILRELERFGVTLGELSLSQHYILNARVNVQIMLLDTCRILYPRYELELVGLSLTFTKYATPIFDQFESD